MSGSITGPKFELIEKLAEWNAHLKRVTALRKSLDIGTVTKIHIHVLKEIPNVGTFTHSLCPVTFTTENFRKLIEAEIETAQNQIQAIKEQL